MNFEKPESVNKEAQWTETRERVDRIVDGVGRGLDEGIKDAVTSFMVHDFPTVASCDALPENHHDGQTSEYPWIEVYSPEPDGWKKSKVLQAAWREQNLEERARMEKFVDEFYKESDMDDENRIYFSNIGIFGGFRVNSKSLEEINRFAEFLKDKFLG